MRIRASLAAVLAVFGFLTLVAAHGVKEARRGAEPRRTGLVRLIRERQAEVDELGATLVKLRHDLLNARHHLSARSEDDARRARRDEMQAGTVGMAGRGLEVVLSNSHRQAKEAADAGVLSVQDIDLQLVVNALWGAGAEAVAVNGQRLVATSPIRAAGVTITVNFRPLVPPYTVRAIGADRAQFERSEAARRFKRWVSDYGLGFKVRPRSRVEVPGYVGALQLSAAQIADVVGGSGGSGGSD